MHAYVYTYIAIQHYIKYAYVAIYVRVESGSYLLTYLTHLTHRAIWIWPTYDPLVTHVLKFSLKKLCKMTWNKSDVKQCHRFLQDTELVPCTESLEVKFWTPHASKQLEVAIGLIPVMVQCIHQTQGSLVYLMPMYFSKEHVIYRVTSR